MISTYKRMSIATKERHENDLQNTWKNLEHWWFVVNEVCTDVHGGDDESDGVMSGSDLVSLCSDVDEPSNKTC